MLKAMIKDKENVKMKGEEGVKDGESEKRVRYESIHVYLERFLYSVLPKFQPNFVNSTS